MPNLSLSLAMGDYDHTRDLLDGKVDAEGIDLTCLRLPVEEIFHRFIRSREWDVSEMSLGKTVAFLAQPQPDIVALPVFPSRAFRHSSIYVRADTTIKRPEDLKRFEELEDRADLRDMEDVLAKAETPIPWKQAKAQLGVK